MAGGRRRPDWAAIVLFYSRHQRAVQPSADQTLFYTAYKCIYNASVLTLGAPPPGSPQTTSVHQGTWGLGWWRAAPLLHTCHCCCRLHCRHLPPAQMAAPPLSAPASSLSPSSVLLSPLVPAPSLSRAALGRARHLLGSGRHPAPLARPSSWYRGGWDPMGCDVHHEPCVVTIALSI